MSVYHVRKIFSYIFYGEALLHGWLKERLVQFLHFPYVGRKPQTVFWDVGNYVGNYEITLSGNIKGEILNKGGIFGEYEWKAIVSDLQEVLKINTVPVGMILFPSWS